MTQDENKTIRIIKQLAADANADPAKFVKAMVEVLEKAFEKYPDDTRKAHKYASSLLNEEYPGREAQS